MPYGVVLKDERRTSNKKIVTVHRFRVQRSAPPLATEVASLIKKVTLSLRSHIRGLRTKKGLKTRNRR